MRANRWTGGLVVACVLSMSGTARADGTATGASQPVQRSAALVLVGNGMVVQPDGENLGRMPTWDAVDPTVNRRYGPGYEQAVVNYVVDNKTPYVVLLVMRSVDKPNIGPYQLMCASYALHPDRAPTKEYEALLTQNPNTKPANHPASALVTGPDGTPYVAYAYGSNWEGHNTATYVGVTNARCQKLSVGTDMRVSPTADLDSENDGAPALISNGKDKVYLGYLSTGGNNDATYFVPLQFTANGAPSLTPILPEPVAAIYPSNIGRPTMTMEGDSREILCASFDGFSRRPPGGGVQCAVLDDVGHVLWKNTIAASVNNNNPYMRRYMAQPTITRLNENQYALEINESNGAAKNGNTRDEKGSNIPHLFLLSRNPATDALDVHGTITGAAPYGTHARICSGAFGVDGARVVNVIGASPIGIGRAASLIVHVDPTQQQPFTYDPVNDWWPISWNGDSGKVSNLLGENPGKQGRDFLSCIGDVPNPGHGVQGGFMSDVKSFFVAAVAGRDVGWDKNGLYLTFLPAQADTLSTPANPVDANAVPATAAPAAAPSGAASSAGCGCSALGGDAGRSSSAGLLLAGLALIVLRGRRRTS